jgi:hypothetical protein
MQLDATRSTPAGFWRFAANYLGAARAVNAKLELGGSLLFPTLYLYGVAIELALKAFLLKRGESLSKLKRLSHSLTDSLALARRRKLGRVLKLRHFEIGAIHALDITYSSTQLRYIVTGTTRVPTVSLLAAVAERLVVGVEGYCTGMTGQLKRYAG